MVSNLSKLEEINVLVSEANWAWPEALRYIFQPRGINLLVAGNAIEFVNILQKKRVHTTIVDMDSEDSDGLATIRIIRMDYPLLPCILLASKASPAVLANRMHGSNGLSEWTIRYFRASCWQAQRVKLCSARHCSLMYSV